MTDKKTPKTEPENAPVVYQIIFRSARITCSDIIGAIILATVAWCSGYYLGAIWGW